MERIRLWAAVAACLVMSAGSGEGCQLSLLRQPVQGPLTFNPFEVGGAAAAVTLTLRNAESKPCNAAFAFFKAGAPQARAGAGAVLNYRVLSQFGGVLTQNAISPPTTLPPGGQTITIGAKQTYTANAVISIPQGQVVGPGSYTDQLTLGVYQSPGGGSYTKALADTFSLKVIITVNSQVTLAMAGGGRNTTLDFGDFVDGSARSVNLLAYSNQSVHLVVSSDNVGVMKLVERRPRGSKACRTPSPS